MLEKKEITGMLECEDQKTIDSLLAEARKVRTREFQNKFFMYGFVYFSTYCRNDCAFCYYRKSNEIKRYRKRPDEILDIARQLADSGVHLLDFTMGEDLTYHEDGFQTMVAVIKQIKRETGLPVMISPGVLDNRYIAELANAGSDWYALYQETHNRDLFGKLRLNQDYDQRMECKEYARKQGMLIEEGLLSGVGETFEDIADSLLSMGRIRASQMRVMSFVPQAGSPMEHVETPGRWLELKIIALMRIMYPNALIPASLDIDGIAGLEARINAGANVVTSIIPPKTGLAGVAQSSMDVDDGGRTAAEVTAILSNMQLEPATKREYQEYIGGKTCHQS